MTAENKLVTGGRNRGLDSIETPHGSVEAALRLGGFFSYAASFFVAALVASWGRFSAENRKILEERHVDMRIDGRARQDV